MAWEVLITGAIGIFCGIVLGALFSQLLFLLLLKIVGLPVALEFVIPFQEAAATFVLFGIGFLILLGYDVISVCRTGPIALLRSEKEGNGNRGQNGPWRLWALSRWAQDIGWR